MAQDTNTGRKDAVWTTLLASLLMYISLLIFHGYIFGSNDHIETIPLMFAMDHPGFYTEDFYIQNILAKSVHERWFFVHFLRFFHLTSPWAIFLLHALFSTAFIIGLKKVSRHFIKEDWLSWLAVAVILIATYNLNTGGNELYYNMLIPSLIAKSLGIWSILYLLRQQWITSFSLITLACLFQPLVGIQLWILFTLSLGCVHLFDQKIRHANKAVVGVIIFLVISTPWLYILYAQHAAGELSNVRLFEIIEFRLSHHFLPSYFSKKGYLLMFFLSVIGSIFYKKKSPVIFYFMSWALIGCIVYTIGVELLHIPLFLDTQWFKTTIWVKAIGVIAAIGWLMETLKKLKFRIPHIPTAIFLSCMLVLLYFIHISPAPIIKNRIYDFPFQTKETDEDLAAQWARENTDKSDLFIVPPDLTAFKWQSKRGSYVEFKSMIHHKDVMDQWYDKVLKVFGPELDIEQYWLSRSADHWQNLYKEGVGFLLSPVNINLDLPIVYQGESLQIYSLKPLIK